MQLSITLSLIDRKKQGYRNAMFCSDGFGDDAAAMITRGAGYCGPSPVAGILQPEELAQRLTAREGPPWLPCNSVR